MTVLYVKVLRRFTVCDENLARQPFRRMASPGASSF
jgi:hypothetical protein